MEIIIKSKKDIPAAAKKLLDYAGNKKVFAFDGPLGAGKTTIIKAICSMLGATDSASSPTFTIINEYRRSAESSLFHIDLYRMKKEEEAFDIGIEEYLSGDQYCFIEWPGIINDLLPEGTVNVRIEVGENEDRMLNVS